MPNPASGPAREAGPGDELAGILRDCADRVPGSLERLLARYDEHLRAHVGSTLAGAAVAGPALRAALTTAWAEAADFDPAREPAEAWLAARVRRARVAAGLIPFPARTEGGPMGSRPIARPSRLRPRPPSARESSTCACSARRVTVGSPSLRGQRHRAGTGMTASPGLPPPTGRSGTGPPPLGTATPGGRTRAPAAPPRPNPPPRRPRRRGGRLPLGGELPASRDQVPRGEGAGPRATAQAAHGGAPRRPGAGRPRRGRGRLPGPRATREARACAGDAYGAGHGPGWAALRDGRPRRDGAGARGGGRAGARRRASGSFRGGARGRAASLPRSRPATPGGRAACAPAPGVPAERTAPGELEAKDPAEAGAANGTTGSDPGGMARPAGDTATGTAAPQPPPDGARVNGGEPGTAAAPQATTVSPRDEAGAPPSAPPSGPTPVGRGGEEGSGATTAAPPPSREGGGAAEGGTSGPPTPPSTAAEAGPSVPPPPTGDATSRRPAAAPPVPAAPPRGAAGRAGQADRGNAAAEALRAALAATRRSLEGPGAAAGGGAPSSGGTGPGPR